VATVVCALCVDEVQETEPPGVQEQEHDPPKTLPLQLQLHELFWVFEQLTVGPNAVAPAPVHPTPSQVPSKHVANAAVPCVPPTNGQATAPEPVLHVLREHEAVAARETVHEHEPRIPWLQLHEPPGKPTVELQL
jgi:hypothetical protein